ncbi:MAG: NYN domain-containing protein [Deltaproteobacteria bacterium]|nr:NYN domain-containing protein [Deltaproteobacteria bacterium]
MHKIAVLLDGGYVLWELRDRTHREATAAEIESVARRCVNEHENLFRIYYYDCMPFGGSTRHPVTGDPIDFSEANTYKYRSELYRSLAATDNFAFRKGQLKFRQWTLKNKEIKRILRNSLPVENWKFLPNLQQKGVDIKIGLDIAWLSTKKVVDRIILFTGDTDFIPAMKFARREGTQVVIASFSNNIKSELKEHADGVRVVDISDLIAAS